MEKRVEQSILRRVRAGIHPVTEIFARTEMQFDIDSFPIKERIWKLLNEHKLELSRDRSRLSIPKAA